MSEHNQEAEIERQRNSTFARELSDKQAEVVQARTTRRAFQDLAMKKHKTDAAKIEGLERELAALREQLVSLKEWSVVQDRPIPEDKEIESFHPLNGGDDKLFAEAVRLVSAKHSKYGLVNAVHWLLSKLASMTAQRDEAVAKTKNTAKDFELAFRLVRQENDSLSRELTALRVAAEGAADALDGYFDSFPDSIIREMRTHITALRSALNQTKK